MKCKPNHRNMIESRKNNPIRLLETIYNLVFAQELADYDSASDHIANISKKYCISDDQVEILAYIAHTYPTRISKTNILDIGTLANEYICAQINELLEREFLNAFNEPDGETYYGITMPCYTALSKNIPFGISTTQNCLEVLKTGKEKDIASDSWKEWFYGLASFPQNQRFMDATKQLEIRNLDETTESCFWILAAFFVRKFTTPFAFSGDNMTSWRSCMNDINIKIGMGNLVKAGLAVSLPIESTEDTHETERYALAPHVVRTMFHGCDELARYDEMTKLTNVILSKDIVEKKLFFSEQSQIEVDNLKKVLSVEGFSRAEEIMRRQHRNPAIQSLFWGPPGTGKTEVIKQIARETGRDLLLFDAAKVTASAWGASEKNYRALFLGYSYLAALCTKVPILLLNECDQMLAKRLTNMERAIDRCENTVSNIILQGFEDMSGIVLATTNLATNLDAAFDRRFLFKTELTKPDAKARTCIWKSLIPELNDAEATTLAETFEMTGAQISNVVAKRNLAELYYEGDRGFEYISDLCKMEVNEPTKGQRSRRVGF